MKNNKEIKEEEEEEIKVGSIEELFYRIPFEVWVAIFSFLVHKWLVVCSRVSRDWRNAAFFLLRKQPPPGFPLLKSFFFLFHLFFLKTKN